MATKKKAIPLEPFKNMTALECVLNPDFSENVKDGKFDAMDAFESHINESKVFLYAAMALLRADEPAAYSALSLLELLEAALDRGIDEAYRVKDTGGEKDQQRRKTA